MRIGIDIGGVISKYPWQFKDLIKALRVHELYIVTDMDLETAKAMLDKNDIFFCIEHILCADYAKYGEMAKAVILHNNRIDVFIDDQMSYLQWDDEFGPAPLRMLVMPDARRPYYAVTWDANNKYGFGREQYKDYPCVC